MQKQITHGQWFGSVGRAVASDASGPIFESSHQQAFILVIYLFTFNWIEQKKIKKEAGMVHFRKQITHHHEGAWLSLFDKDVLGT